MKHIAAASLALALLGGAGALHAQNPPPARPPAQQAPGARPQGQPQPPAAAPGEIRGTVVDAESGTPLGAASVSVFSRPDSALVAGAIARADGSFRIEGLRPGSYSLRISMMGYRPQAGTVVTIAAEQPRAAVGPIRLARSAVALEGLTATGERQAVAIAPDRNTYQARTVAPAATSASEVLEAVPSVQVDPDGKVSLRGNENVVVQINGRPSPMRGAQLAGYLKQLPANTLERVEVIPNPSARQDPEGMAGIINIVLKQNVDLGLSGGLTLAGSTSNRYVASGNLGWQKGPATLFGSYGFVSDGRDVTGINNRTRLVAASPFSYTNQDVSGSVLNGGHNFNGSLDYRLSAKNTLYSALLLNARFADDDSRSDYNILDPSLTLVDQYLRLRENDADGRMVDYSLGFKRTMVPQRHELTGEVRLNRNRDLDHTDLWRQPVTGGARTDAEINRTDALTWQLTGQTDYTRALGARGKLETGYKGWARWLDRDYAVETDPLGTGVFTPRTDLSNALELDETVNAAYAVLSQGAGRWELQGGLRAEFATRDFTLANTGETFAYDKWSVFPSALASYKLGDNDQLKLSYSRRVRRPGTQELSPFPVFFDLQNVFLGNPNLDPEYTDAIELGYQHSARMGSLQVSPFFRRTSNVIRFIVNTVDTVQGREVTSINFQNLDHGTSWGADVNGTLRYGQKFNGLASFNVFKLVTEGGGESTLGSNAVSWAARVNGTYNVSPRTSFTAAYFYRAAVPIERGQFGAVGVANFSVRQKLMGEQASLTVRLSDPFKGNLFRVETGNDDVFQLTERTFNTRAVHVTFQYNFGRPPRVRPQEQPQPPAPTPFGG
ncbi:MAG: TonB-dependent receptor domain-containing protein [Longimicrobiaceae bacterium]